MRNNAHQTLKKIEKNPGILEKNLMGSLGSKRVSGVRVLKDKYIVGNKYKITGLAIFSGGNPTSAVFEIHDDGLYFARSLYALQELAKIRIGKQAMVAALYGVDKTKKIILRENVQGKKLDEYLKNRGTKEREKENIIKKLALWLASVHAITPKKVPKPLHAPLNEKYEKVILKKILSFLKPNLNRLKPHIQKNLFHLLSLMKQEKKLCLIHGDFQISNIYVSNNSVKILDFDTMELGNPGRDIGRFLAQIDETLKARGEKYKKYFLKNYFAHGPYPQKTIGKNILLHQIEMMQYILLGMVWGKKTASQKKIQGLLKKQDRLFSLLYV